MHGSVPMPILIPFGHPFGLLRPLHHVLNCVVLGKLLFKSLATGSSRVINQQPARSHMNFVTLVSRLFPRRKDCFSRFFLTLILQFFGVHVDLINYREG